MWLAKLQFRWSPGGWVVPRGAVVFWVTFSITAPFRDMLGSSVAENLPTFCEPFSNFISLLIFMWIYFSITRQLSPLSTPLSWELGLFSLGCLLPCWIISPFARPLSQFLLSHGLNEGRFRCLALFFYSTYSYIYYMPCLQDHLTLHLTLYLFLNFLWRQNFYSDEINGKIHEWLKHLSSLLLFDIKTTSIMYITLSQYYGGYSLPMIQFDL